LEVTIILCPLLMISLGNIGYISGDTKENF